MLEEAGTLISQADGNPVIATKSDPRHADDLSSNLQASRLVVY
jgi:hypothetical protein